MNGNPFKYVHLHLRIPFCSIFGHNGWIVDKQTLVVKLVSSSASCSLDFLMTTKISDEQSWRVLLTHHNIVILYELNNSRIHDSSSRSLPCFGFLKIIQWKSVLKILFFVSHFQKKLFSRKKIRIKVRIFLNYLLNFQKPINWKCMLHFWFLLRLISLLQCCLGLLHWILYPSPFYHFQKTGIHHMLGWRAK